MDCLLPRLSLCAGEGTQTLDARELLVDNLDVVERAIRFAARRYRLDPSDAEEFEGIVKLRLVENDYAVLRAFERRSSFRTFISIVVQRMALDFRIHAWGKWRPSAEAKRLGDLAVDLDELLNRDGRTLEEAVQLLAAKHDGVSPASLATLAAKLPKHSPRPRSISLDDAVGEMPVQAPSADHAVIADERRHASHELSRLLAAIMEGLPDEDRLILQLHFEGGMTVAQIARALAFDQKLTYRRIDRNKREIKRALERAGFEPGEVLDLIGREEVFLHFDIGNRVSGPSMRSDERTGPHTEES
jgi:RNA polymerase sigma factor for flagellar operon FliA